MNFEQAAAMPMAGVTALQGLRDLGKIQAGQHVLVNGASGGVGTYAIQLAKYFGAEVIGVCSTANLELVKMLGADTVMDYTREDFTQNGQTYDVIFDVMGKSSFSGSIQSLKPNGLYLLGGNSGPSQMLRGRWVSITSSKSVIIGAANQKTEDLVFLKDLIEAGKLKSVIDRRYPLEQTAEAHRYVETGQKKGHVVITVE